MSRDASAQELPDHHSRDPQMSRMIFSVSEYIHNIRYRDPTIAMCSVYQASMGCKSFSPFVLSIPETLLICGTRNHYILLKLLLLCCSRVLLRTIFDKTINAYMITDGFLLFARGSRRHPNHHFFRLEKRQQRMKRRVISSLETHFL